MGNCLHSFGLKQFLLFTYIRTCIIEIVELQIFFRVYVLYVLPEPNLNMKKSIGLFVLES